MIILSPTKKYNFLKNVAFKLIGYLVRQLIAFIHKSHNQAIEP